MKLNSMQNLTFKQFDYVAPFLTSGITKEINQENKYSPSLKVTASNPAKLLELCAVLIDDSSKSMEIKINTFLMKETESEATFLLYLMPYYNEAVVQVIGNENLEKEMRFTVTEAAMINLVQYENSLLKCDDELEPQIRVILMSLYKHLGHQFTLIPILSKKYRYLSCSTQNIKPIILVCFVDSKKTEEFQIDIANEVFKLCHTILINTLNAEEKARIAKHHENLLIIVHNLFSRLKDVNDLFVNIALEAKRITNARQCYLFLIHSDMMTKKVITTMVNAKLNIKLGVIRDEKIAKHVALTGEIVNVTDPQEHPLFDKSEDESFGTRIRNVLCFPLKNENITIGVIQLNNKRNGNFCIRDVDTVKIFGIYCGLIISHSLTYTQIKDKLTKSQISNKLIINYKNVTYNEVTNKITCGFLHLHPQFNQFDFSPRSVTPKETVCFILQLFEDLDFFKRFSIRKRVLTKFIMMVQKCHRDMPYHNWTYTFSIIHFAYLCLKKFQLVEKQYVSDLESLVYFLTCLCYNLEYRGVNNPFQKRSLEVLTCLYSSQGSVMQRERLSYALAILNTEDCNILENLENDKYQRCLKLMKDLFLASDLVNHFKLYRRQYLMAKEGYKKDNSEHRYIFICLLTTCASFADQLKNLKDIEQSTAEAFEELLILDSRKKQCGKEKIMLSEPYLTMISDIKIEFLRNACLPAFKLMVLMFPVAKELVHKIKQNILYWEAAKPFFKQAFTEGRSCIEVLKSEDLHKYIESTLDALSNT